MGDFVLNKSFGMLQDQGTHYIIKMLQRALTMLGPCGPVPWTVQLGLRLMPRVGVFQDWHTIVSWCEEQMKEQTKVVHSPSLSANDISPNQQKTVNMTQTSCLARHHIDDARGDISQEEWKWLKGDSLQAIVAGR